MIPKPNEKDYTNPSICKECGGYCCKECPGDFIPSDFGETKTEILSNILKMLKFDTLRIYTRVLRKEFDKNIRDYSIDVVLISPASKPERRNRWGWGECVFLGSEGCKLSFSKRPIVCRYLPPYEDKKCRTRLNLDHVILQWIGYEDILNCLKSINRRMRRKKSLFIRNSIVSRLQSR